VALGKGLITTDSTNDRFIKNFRKGIEQFNNAQFFACHETLESVWKDQAGSQREFIQGIIQIAVGYYHLLNDNELGAGKLLRRGLDRIGQFAPVFLGVEVSTLANSVEETLKRLEPCNPYGMAKSISREERKRELEEHKWGNTGSAGQNISHSFNPPGADNRAGSHKHKHTDRYIELPKIKLN
jgi:predicted metal-dependent hydrolase